MSRGNRIIEKLRRKHIKEYLDPLDTLSLRIYHQFMRGYMRFILCRGWVYGK